MLRILKLPLSLSKLNLLMIVIIVIHILIFIHLQNRSNCQTDLHNVKNKADLEKSLSINIPPNKVSLTSNIKPNIPLVSERTQNLKSKIQEYKMRNRKNINFIKQTNNILIKISKFLATAHRYARSGITMLEINSAYSLVQNIIHNNTVQLTHQNLRSMSDIIQDDALDDNSVERPDECPEEYVENLQTFRIVNCKKKAIEHVVSFVFLLPNCKVASNILSGLPERYRNIRVVVGVEEMSDECKSLNKLRLNKFELIRSKVADNGSGWRRLLSRVDTKYVLIGRDLYSFNNEANIERLIRIVSVTGVDAMGGAQRLKNGHWSTGCYQMAIKNYTLKLVEGYDQSYNSCIYCDYLSTAFISRRDILLNKLSSTMSGASLFVDYFMTLFRADKIGAMSCPDVMFSTINNDISNQSREMWQTVAREWKLNRIVLPNNKDIWFKCYEVNIACTSYMKKAKGEVNAPCCLEMLQYHVLDLMKTVNDKGVYMELNEGTLVGAVKFTNTLPWEVDADMYYSKNESALFSDVLTIIQNNGYAVTKHKVADRYTINFGGTWFADWYGISLSAPDRHLYEVSTKVLFNGVWLNSPPNPVLYLRRLYGDDVFQHVEHWRPIFDNKENKNWTQIKKGYFLPCEKSNFHGCLNRYIPSGNIQFRDIWI